MSINEEIRDNPEEEISNTTNYLYNSISNSVNYSNIIIENKTKFVYKNPYGKYIEEKSCSKYNNVQFKDITIVLCLKNRPKRFGLFYKLNKLFFEKYNIKLIVVEGKSHNMINTNLFKKDSHITHYVVDIKNVWSRSVLLNYGVDKCKTDIVILSDIDFIYTVGFWDNILDLLNHTDLKKSFIGVPLYESEKTFTKGKLVRNKYLPYSACYIINKNVFISVGGFNTKMTGYGMEERELQNRLKRNGVNTIYTGLIYPYCYVIHYSHSCNLRGSKNHNNLKICSTSKITKIEFKTYL